MNSKKIFIVGGTSGFGLSLAKNFEKENCVYVCGRRSSNNPNFLTLDMVDISEKTFDLYKPDVIVNNGFDKNNYIKSYQGSLNVLRCAFNFFKQKKDGIIINVNSFYGVNPDVKDPDYAAAKHGLKGYVDSISAEAFLNNIKIINLYPRAMKKTGMNAGRIDENDLIDPDEVAELVVTLTKTKSFYVSSIQFDRIKI